MAIRTGNVGPSLECIENNMMIGNETMTVSYNNDIGGILASNRMNQQSDSSISSAFLAQQMKATG